MKKRDNAESCMYILLSALLIANVLLIIFYNKPKPTEKEKEIVIETSIVKDYIFIDKEIDLIKYERIEVDCYDAAAAQLEEIHNKIFEANEVLESFESLGYSYQTLDNWYVNFLIYMEEERIYYQDKVDYYWNIEQIGLWENRKEEYPVATTIWLFLKEQGYNDYVAAGILGNMMTEAGGQTLYINSAASSGSYYGICQWGPGFSGRYVDLDGQLQLLMNTIEDEFKWYGNISYENFCLLENEKDAAIAFAKSYERCTSASYEQRKANATIALEYFTN